MTSPTLFRLATVLLGAAPLASGLAAQAAAPLRVLYEMFTLPNGL
jgi:hypothetical protein